MAVDAHNLGEFASISDAWKLYPNGGGFGDYITVNGVRVDWNEYSRSWGEQTETGGTTRPDEVVPHSIDVQGTGTFRDGVKVGSYVKDTSGANIDQFGNAEFRNVQLDALMVKYGNDFVPLSEFIKTFKTELPPDWTEYTEIPLFDDVRLLVFDENSSEKFYTTIGALKAVIGSGGSSGGGTVNIEIIRSDEPDKTPTDNNVFSALRTLLEITKAIKAEGEDLFLSKINPDTAAALIKFLAGSEFGEFIPGMFGGKGAKIDSNGNIEATSLRLRALLEVPELRYNRLTVIGDEFILTENALIESVQHLVDRSYKLNIKLEEGEAIAYDAGTLIKGIFNNAATSGTVATSYMRIEEVGPTFIKITLANDVDVPTGYNLPPQPFMNVARVGHVTDTNKQRYMVFSSRFGGYQLYDGASDFMNGTLVASFDVAQSFKSKFNNLPLKEGLPYVYAAGLVVQDIIRVDYQGVSIREIYDRGPWQSGVTYYNNDINGTDDVWHLGCRWRCFSAFTTEEPSWTSAAWTMIEGRSDARMEFDSSNGFAFFAGNVDTVITPVVFIGNTNVSADIVEEQWSWIRESGDPAADNIWNIQRGSGRLLQLTTVDMGALWSKTNPVRFTCTATYPASSINNITSYIEV
ncbi:hypothetical protein [Petrimonas sp.]|uniref:hypothetical protein n=1 Tax=Petrimonas sp. TaxID=2023866 RepID=UPI002FCC3851